jgi:hypothetical protein
MKLRIAGVCIAGLLVCASSRAYADAFVITSGFVRVDKDADVASLELIGDGIHIFTHHVALGTLSFPAGEPVVIHDTVSSPFVPEWSATIQGTSFSFSKMVLLGSLDLIGAAFTAPNAPGTRMTFTTPFTMTGDFTGCTSTNIMGCIGPPVFDVTVTGSGSLRIVAGTDTGARWFSANDDLFTFSASSINPTPEPGTLLLLASGLMLARVRRSRKR